MPTYKEMIDWLETLTKSIYFACEGATLHFDYEDGVWVGHDITLCYPRLLCSFPSFWAPTLREALDLFLLSRDDEGRIREIEEELGVPNRYDHGSDFAIYYRVKVNGRGIPVGRFGVLKVDRGVVYSTPLEYGSTHWELQNAFGAAMARRR